MNAVASDRLCRRELKGPRRRTSRGPYDLDKYCEGYGISSLGSSVIVMLLGDEPRLYVEPLSVS